MAIQVIFQNWLNLHATINSSILSPSNECTVAVATLKLHRIYGHNVTKIHTHTATPTPRNTRKYCVCAQNEWYNILLFNSISSLTVKYVDEQLCCKHYQKSSMSINQEIIIVRYPTHLQLKLQVTHKFIFGGDCNLSRVSFTAIKWKLFLVFENGDFHFQRFIRSGKWYIQQNATESRKIWHLLWTYSTTKLSKYFSMFSNAK